ncbi:hypothetical protein TNIN_170141 [Trichonephila inaurata madagascariensis]|uniref:Uncharacterized protein n=1 Tax=Trichonephila inaurata madagascariensis TaxID=2747483 RepID=A0A8X7BYL1_9ARAC|nr:hypothetical protein TNIN_170141 [Trichonephila inaurata madagascariensis]
MQSISASDFVDRLGTHIRVGSALFITSFAHARGTAPFVFKDLETGTYALLQMTPFVAPYNLHIRDIIAFATYQEGFRFVHRHKGSSCQRGSHKACLCPCR